MKYKAGDRVRIQSLEWHQKEIESEKWCSNIFDVYWCSREMTISKIEKSQYLMEEDGQEFYWTDEMIEGLVEEETLIERVDDNGLPFNEWLSHKGAFHVPDGYELKDENGNIINTTKIVLEKKKKEYPKTYEECCKILGIEGNSLLINTKHITYYERDLGKLMGQFHRLIIYRDAYWKIAGEEMGLGKPWMPDWEDENQEKYIIGSWLGTIQGLEENFTSHPLAFPTEEIRDAFKKNFDPDIEICKELL